MNTITPFVAYYQVPPFTLPSDRKEWEKRLVTWIPVPLDAPPEETIPGTVSLTDGASSGTRRLVKPLPKSTTNRAPLA